MNLFHGFKRDHLIRLDYIPIKKNNLINNY